MNNNFLKLTIYFKDKVKYVSILEMLVNYSNNKNKNIIFLNKSLNF